jgi:cell division protein FtsI/penicillin-binding protein 2
MDVIQARILKLSKKMLDKLKNQVFGDSQVEKFEVGEIFRWPGWHIEENKVTRDYKYGVLLSVYTGKLDKREIKIAQILPFGEDKPIKISLLLVKKSDLED